MAAGAKLDLEKDRYIIGGENKTTVEVPSEMEEGVACIDKI